MYRFEMRGRILTDWSIFKQASVSGLVIAELAAWPCRAGRIYRGYLHKKTSRRRHGPLCPSALTLKGITERPLPQHGLH